MKIEQITVKDEPITYVGMGCMVYEPNGIPMQEAREELNERLYDKTTWSGKSDLDYLNDVLNKYPKFFDKDFFKTLY